MEVPYLLLLSDDEVHRSSILNPVGNNGKVIWKS
jgi:hypothetical protein